MSSSPLTQTLNSYINRVVYILQGVTYPSIHAIWSKWAPPQEKTKLATLAFSGKIFVSILSHLESTYDTTLKIQNIFYSKRHYKKTTCGLLRPLCKAPLFYNSKEPLNIKNNWL